MKKQQLLIHADRFLQKKSNERRKLDKLIHKEEQKVHDIKNPHLCKNIDQLRDDILSQILNSSELYDHFEIGAEVNKQKQEIMIQAQMITENLEKQAEKSREKALVNIKKLKQSQMMHMLVGNKTQQLVHKFIRILKEKVEKKRLDVLKKNNE